MTLFEQVIQHLEADLELWKAINGVLGFHDINECRDWPVRDSNVDEWDGSVEVVCDPTTPPFTREQANLILEFGFREVFEVRGTTGVKWTPKRRIEYQSDGNSTKDKRFIQKYRNEIKRLKQRIGETDCGDEDSDQEAQG